MRRRLNGWLRPNQHYGLAKLASEGRHRALSKLTIIDLRLFGLYSHHIVLSAGFLMNEVVRCVLDGTTLVTGPVVGKFELLEAFRDRFGLTYTIDDAPSIAGARGSKPAYFSLSRKAGTLGYAPTRTALATLIEESEALFRTKR